MGADPVPRDPRLAVWLIPPSARRHWSLLQHEAELQQRNLGIRREVEKVRQATLAFETDPFYRETAIRFRLGIKRSSERYLASDETDETDEETETR